MRRAEEKRRRTRATDDVEQLIFRSCYYKKKKGRREMESKGRKTNLGGFWRERERSDGERETLGTVFRSSFNN